jgi:hypothetical protein
VYQAVCKVFYVEWSAVTCEESGFGIYILFCKLCLCLLQLHYTGLSGAGGEGMKLQAGTKGGGRMKKSESAYYHVCTDGHALDWMFKDTADFIAGANRIGICMLETSVVVIAFILMDNHVHFVLYGTIVQCKKFITRYKALTGMWIRSKYGIDGHLKRLPSQLVLIEDEEQLLDTIAYIDRNSIVAGYGLLPGEYPWGSARFMFSHDTDRSGVQLSEMTQKDVRELLGTWVQLPGDWKVDREGMIVPTCFLDVDQLHRLFKTPLRYLYHLSKKLEGKVEMQGGIRTFIPDKELRNITDKLIREMFGTVEVGQLDFNSRIALARKLRYDYASTLKQISRMLHLDVDALCGFV